MLALFVADSGNTKIQGTHGGKVAATYSSIEATCPRSCALYQNKFCYAMSGHVLFTLRRFKGAKGSRPEQAAREEAAAIDTAFKGGPVPQDGARGGRDLRLHVSGDARTPGAAKILAGAIARWFARGGGAAWTYTHAHKSVPRAAWGPTSVLASVDRLEDVPAAKAQGYAPARYVAEFPSEKAWEEGGTKWIPCPAQTRDNVGCADCRLCFNDQALRERNAGIAFSAHGAKQTAMKRRLTVVQA
jgi:hypothetical protein